MRETISCIYSPRSSGSSLPLCCECILSLGRRERNTSASTCRPYTLPTGKVLIVVSSRTQQTGFTLKLPNSRRQGNITIDICERRERTGSAREVRRIFGTFTRENLQRSVLKMLSSSIKMVAKQLKSSTFSATELCDASLRRIENTKSLNAFITVTHDIAHEQAKESDKRHSKGESKGELDGIPIAVKDNFCTQGVLTSCGSHMLSNFLPPYNATVVSRLQDAGTVMVGKCNLDEFAMGSGTVDSIYGPTKNVWGSNVPYEVLNSPPSKQRSASHEKSANLDEDWHIAGGSSGGSAVAVATGSCFAALGSDTGGSTRNPAAYCGVVGFKPSYGLVSRHGLIPLVNSMDVPGIIARSVEDVTSVLNAIAGPDDNDSTTVRQSFSNISLEETVTLKGLRIGIPKEYQNSSMSQEMIEVWRYAASILNEGGATVSEVSLPHTSSSIACYSVLNQCEVASNMARYDGLRFGIRGTDTSSTEQLYAETRSRGFNEVVRSRILSGNYFLLKRNYEKYFVKALKVRRLIKRDFDNVWNNNIDILLTPTTLSQAPRLSDFRQHDNQTQCVTQDYCTQPANMAGIPAICLPIRLSTDGLPLSLQFMAPMFQESTLMKTALWLQNAVNFPRIILKI
ncbi:Glutamyl-tRNA(Gln) amidotransferase subunit A, mitochondrial [Frankliniella fusca]|uniref:Glutamyl-tRNA(Gln) amidotransferase subunit A, mitochondrial n=1 Tax=Frankliniella fusca TaxID=407009 RepID=A0AAE1HR11_9NEOP|nr:Glutamyl-tRNA(Gln) amidotransferase subunit A, mitochondrial [Frankliniella fusca]